MTTKDNNGSWIRLAGHGTNIKARARTHWRISIEGQEGLIPLLDWRLLGEATAENVRPGTNPDKDAKGLIAWIDYFGTVEVKDQVATISLLNPPEGP